MSSAQDMSIEGAAFAVTAVGALCLGLCLPGCDGDSHRQRYPPPRLENNPNMKPPALAEVEGKPTKITTFQRPETDPKVLAELESACDSGNLSKCVELGTVHQSAADYAAAETPWAKACDEGESAGCQELGNMLTNPFLKLGRDAEGVEYLERGCELGNVGSCYFLGGAVDFGRYGVEADPKRARALYEKGCDDGKGHHWSCVKVQAGSVAKGGNCKWDACVSGLWCIQAVCSDPPQ